MTNLTPQFETSDPLEHEIAAALDILGIDYDRSLGLDFYLPPPYDVFIECKAHFTERAIRQLADKKNVILLQGIGAVHFLTALLIDRKMML